LFDAEQILQPQALELNVWKINEVVVGVVNKTRLEIYG
jgi:hypothetical protein